MIKNSFSLREPLYYHQEYKNNIDNKNKSNLVSRIAQTSLQFAVLYKPLNYPISLVMGSLRVVTNSSNLLASLNGGNRTEKFYSLLHTVVSVISVASTVFAHPAGMLITTGQDLILEIAQLINNIRNKRHKKAFENCLNLVNNGLYLALFFSGGIEIMIASLSLQILLGLHKSYHEFNKGNFIEGTGQLLMSIIRGNQLHTQVKVLKFKWNVESVIKNRNLEEKDSKSTIARKSSAITQLSTNNDIQILSDKLRPHLTESELNHVINIIQQNQIHDPVQILLSFSKDRPWGNNHFTTKSIKIIAESLASYNVAWKDIEKRDDLWIHLFHQTFPCEKKFFKEDYHGNYESNRLMRYIYSNKGLPGIPLSTNIVSEIIQDGFIGREQELNQIEDKLWYIAYQSIYGYYWNEKYVNNTQWINKDFDVQIQNKVVANENWKENFDIAYQTMAFCNHMNWARAWIMDDIYKYLEMTILAEFPKTSKIDLSSFQTLTSDSLVSIVNRTKYLQYFIVKYSGYIAGNKIFREVVNDEVIDALKNCSELKHIDVTVINENLKNNLIESFKDNPKIEHLSVIIT